MTTDALPLAPPTGPGRRAGALFAAAVGVGFVGAGLTGAVIFAAAANRAAGPADAAAFAAAALVSLAMGAGLAFLLWREARAEYGWRAEVNGPELTVDRGGARTTLDLRTLDRLTWPIVAHGAVALSGPGGTVRLTPKAFDPATRVAFVRRLRAAVPTEVQHRWPEYCERVALDLVRCDLPTRPLRPGERVETGELSAGFGLVSVLIGEAGGWLALWWLTGAARFLLFGTVVGLAVAGLRWWAGRSARPRIVADSPMDAAMVRALLWFCGLAAAGACPAVLLIRRGWPAGGAIALCLAPAAVAYFRGFWRGTRVHQTWRAERSAAAVAEWDALHAPAPPAGLTAARNPPGPVRAAA